MQMLTNQHHFSTTNIWDALNVNASRMKLLLKNFQRCFESRISAGATEKLPVSENLTQNRSRGPTTWKDMLGKCVERYFELANKKV